MPIKIFNNVDFPDPDLPTIETNPAFGKTTLILSKTTFSVLFTMNDFLISCKIKTDISAPIYKSVQKCQFLLINFLIIFDNSF